MGCFCALLEVISARNTNKSLMVLMKKKRMKEEEPKRPSGIAWRNEGYKDFTGMFAHTIRPDKRSG